MALSYNREKQGELMAAYGQIVQNLHNIKAESENEFTGSKYVKLDQWVDLIRTAAAEHDVAVIQDAEVRVNGDAKVLMLEIYTYLIKGAETVSFGPFSMPVPEGKGNIAQRIGSTLTYGRRYHLTALFGVCGTDEDVDGGAGEQPVVARVGKFEFDENIEFAKRLAHSIIEHSQDLDKAKREAVKASLPQWNESNYKRAMTRLIELLADAENRRPEAAYEEWATFAEEGPL